MFRANGPAYEVVLDEIGLRRFSVSPGVMHAQIRHLMLIAEQEEPRLTLKIFPIRTGRTSSLLPKSAIILYTFPDPADPEVAVEETVAADHVRTQPTEVAKYVRRYEAVQAAALSPAQSRRLLDEIAEQITDEAGPVS